MDLPAYCSRLLVPLIGGAAFLLAAGMTTAGAALAHGGVDDVADPLGAWNLTVLVTVATILAAGLYAAGIRRWRRAGLRVGIWRQTSYYTGLAVIFLALQSPIDALADHLFFMHQIEHLMIRMIGPMLLVLAVPQAPILKGFPAWARLWLAKPVIRNRAARALYRFLADPLVATVLFVAALYVWQVPKFYDFALLNAATHEVMHASMLLTGLFFWWLIVDPRKAKSRVTYGIRLLMLVFALLTNIPLGAYLAFKEQAIYSAYGAGGRLWGFSALADEQQGGLIMWIPGSMMFVIGALIVLRMLYLHEQRMVAPIDRR